MVVDGEVHLKTTREGGRRDTAAEDGETEGCHKQRCKLPISHRLHSRSFIHGKKNPSSKSDSLSCRDTRTHAVHRGDGV